jgi:hypothetical protein
MPLPVIAGAAAAVASRLAAKKLAQEAAKKTAARTAQIAKNSVKTKPARKPVGNPVNQEKSIESMISSVSRGGLKTGGTLGKGRDHRVANSKKLKWEPNSRKVLDEIAAMKKTKTVKINSGVKSKTADQARSNATKKSAKLIEPVTARVPARIPEVPARGKVRINSAKTRSGKVVNLKNAPTSVEKVTGRLAASSPARRPEPNPANPPRGTVKIRSGNQRPAVLQKRAAALKKK